jgi:hypothetical protein
MLHSFDLGGSPMVTSAGHMVGGNPEAAADFVYDDEDFPRCAAQDEVAERTPVPRSRISS